VGVTVSVAVRKKGIMSNSHWLARQELMEFPDVTAVDILLSGWMKSESPPHEVLARILDAAVCVKKHEDQHRRKTRDL